MGSGCSRRLIEEGAACGKGKYEFIADNDDMNGKVISLLNVTVTPFLDSFALKFDKSLVEMVSPNPEKILLRKNEPFNVWIFMNKKFEEMG